MSKKKAWITASVLSSLFAATVYVDGTEWLQTKCAELKQFEEKLQQRFPVKPDELCLPNPATLRL